MWRQTVKAEHETERKAIGGWRKAPRYLRGVVAALIVGMWALGGTPANARLLLATSIDFGFSIEDDGYQSYTIDAPFVPQGYTAKKGWLGLEFDNYYAQQFDSQVSRFSVHLRARRSHSVDELAEQLLSDSHPPTPGLGMVWESRCPDKVGAIRSSLAGQQALVEIPCDYSPPTYDDSADDVLVLFVHGLTAIRVEVVGAALVRPVSNGPNEVVEPTPLYDDLMAEARLFVDAFLANAQAEGFDTVTGYGDQPRSPTVDAGTSPQPDPGTIQRDGNTSGETSDWSADATAVAIATAAGAAAAGGLAGLGAWLGLGQTGIGRRELLESLGDLLRGRLPDDGFEAWKAKYQALGWTYREEKGIAVFEPPQGRAEPPPTTPPLHRDGEIDPNTGEVWSEEDRAWIGQNLYDQERARRVFIDDVNARAATPDAEIHRLYQDWQASRRKLDAMPALFAGLEMRRDMMDRRIEEMIADCDDPDRLHFLSQLQGKLWSIDAADPENELPRLRRTLNRAQEPGFTQTAFVSTSLIHGGAFLTDIALTRGAATAAVHALEATEAAVEQNLSPVDAALAGANTGAKTMLGFWLMGEALSAGGTAFAEAAPEAANAIEALANTRLTLRPANAAGTRVWGGNMGAVRDEINARAAATLSADSGAVRIGNINRAGEINRTLREIGGCSADPRLVTIHNRLTPGHTTYQAGVDALALDETARRALSPEARLMADGVRQDLYLGSVEGGVKRLYAERPDLAGKLLRVDNTGSHAQKLSNYRGLPSDVDGTFVGDGSAAGEEAARLASRYQAEEVARLTNGRLSNENLKVHIYTGEGEGIGAYRSEAGLTLKDMMNATSGRIDVLDAEGNLTHSLRGGDAVETGVQVPRFTPAEGMTEGEASAYLEGFRRDSLGKFQAELPDMATVQEQATQAAKAYRLARIAEAKLPGGRSLDIDRELYDLATGVKSEAGTMSEDAVAALKDRFLGALGRE